MSRGGAGFGSAEMLGGERWYTFSMSPTAPTNPDIRRQLRARLYDLSPRAFELFAGELLTFVGLSHVHVTRYIGDGGIDAYGELRGESDLVRVPTGVQVKRHRQNVQRPDIDRFIGALSGQFSHGIFITMAGYAEQARAKARSAPVRIDTIGGDQVIALMGRHQLGLVSEAATDPQIDEPFFLAFEAQAARRAGRIGDEPAPYQASDPAGPAARPEDDLISLRALSYELRTDPYTILDWVRGGRLLPDSVARVGQRESYFFRRDRLATIRGQLSRAALPTSGPEWRQAFLDFVRSRNLTRSYKPVLLKVLLQTVDRNGAAQIAEIAQGFIAFYRRRQHAGLPTERDGPLTDPSTANLEAVQALIVKNPLERFRIQGFLQYDPASGVVRFAPPLWAELRAYEILDIQTAADAQLRHYYRRKA